MKIFVNRLTLSSLGFQGTKWRLLVGLLKMDLITTAYTSATDGDSTTNVMQLEDFSRSEGLKRKQVDQTFLEMRRCALSAIAVHFDKKLESLTPDTALDFLARLCRIRPELWASQWYVCCRNNDNQWKLFVRGVNRIKRGKPYRS